MPQGVFHPSLPRAQPYPAVLIDGLQPFHSHVPDVASPEEDLAWKREPREQSGCG